MITDPQTLTLAAYTTLTLLRPSGEKAWPGALILAQGLDPQGAALATAAVIAGAACLTLEPDAAICRAAMRTGACDFVVNSVDEALRILKNEIRKRQPISVGVEVDPQVALAELAERGVFPQLASRVALTAEQTHDFTAADPLAAYLAAHNFRLEHLTRDSTQQIRTLDQALQTLVPAEDPRHPWLRAAPRFFPRDRHRAVHLTPAELLSLNA